VIRYLLDTNIISELRKPKPHGAVSAWFGALRDEQVYLSAVSLGELQEGIERTRKEDESKARSIEAWVDQLEETLVVLPVDGRCFREAARIMLGKQVELFDDAMIAAVARVHGLTVATRNEKDLKRLGVAMINPFKPREP
jgi:predicted nucleic acid-binding protein